MTQVQFESGKMIQASAFGKDEEVIEIEYTKEESDWADSIRVGDSFNV